MDGKTSLWVLQNRKARQDDPEKFQDEPQGSVFMAVADTLGYGACPRACRRGKNNVEDYSTDVSNDLE